MIPQHIYDAIIESPAGKLINRLLEEDANARGIWDSTPGAHGSIIDQLYETITTAQKKQRVHRLKQSNQDRLAKYQAIAKAQAAADHANDFEGGDGGPLPAKIHKQKPTTVQWSALGDFMSWEPTGESDE